MTSSAPRDPRRTAWRTACQAASVPTSFLHDCHRTAARNLIRASIAERVAMLLTGHTTRAIFDRDNIINEHELLKAGDQLVAYLAQQAQATPRARALGRPAHRAAPPPRATHDRVRAGGSGRRARRGWARGRPRGGRDPLTARPTVGPRRAIPPRRRTTPPTPPRGAPDWHRGGIGVNEESRRTDRRHDGASASHAGRGHRVSQPPTHLP